MSILCLIIIVFHTVRGLLDNKREACDVLYTVGEKYIYVSILL